MLTVCWWTSPTLSLMQPGPHIITPPSTHSVLLINDFTSYSEASEAATKKRPCYVSCLAPAARQKNTPAPGAYFYICQAGSPACLMKHSFSSPCRRYMACECLRMQGQRSGTRSSDASKFSRPSHRRMACSVFSDSKCLYGASDRGFVQILRGNS